MEMKWDKLRARCRLQARTSREEYADSSVSAMELCPNNSGSVPFPANFSFFIEVIMRKKTGTRLSNEEPVSVGAKISEDG